MRAGAALVPAVAVLALPSLPAVRTLTGPSGCDAAGSAQRDLVAGAEVEPSLATDARGRVVVVAYQADRSRRGGAGGVEVVVSSDGGAVWRAPKRLFGSCSAAAAPISDPWASIGRDGRVYVTALDTSAGVVARVSADGGASWSKVVHVAAQTAALILDKPTVLADPLRPNVAYATWEQYPVAAGGPPVAGDTALAVTRDGGRTWSRPLVFLRHAGAFGPMTTNVVAGPGRDELSALSLWIHGPAPGIGRPSPLLLQHSSNGGRTWSRPRTVATVRSAWTALRDPATRKGIRPSVPSFALDAATGRFYAAWADDRYSSSPTIDHVVLSRSTAGGAWTTPRRVDTGGIGIIPSVAAERGGVVAVTYFTLASRGSRAAYWLARSHDGGRHFTRTRVGPSFSLADAPFLTGVASLLVPGGYFLGDYMGLASTRRGLVTAYVSSNRAPANPTDVRFARLP